MNNSDIKDPLFLEAVEYIDSGNLPALQQLVEKNPRLISERLDLPEEGYFKNPYLLWFVAENPIRHETLPANIIEITKYLVAMVKRYAADSFQMQIDYTLGLVATGCIPRESGVQIKWMDLLIDGGAQPGGAMGALAHGNIEAAKHLINRSGKLNLAAAICLNLTGDIPALLGNATDEDKEIALVAASFYGRADFVKLILEKKVNVNAYLPRTSGFHSHATALHQAVASGSLDTVKLLVDAGANLNATDRVYQGTPLGWAKYMQTEENDEAKKKQYAEIETYLLSRPDK